jgi:phosphohistidine phosphatase
VECGALSPGASPEELLDALRRRAGNADCVAVVGHQPHLGRLVALCLKGEARPEAFELKKSAVVCLRFEGAPRAGEGMLEWSLPPRVLRKL